MSLSANTEIAMIHELIEMAANEYNNNIAFIYREKEYTFEEINVLTKRVANHFLSLGLKKGDVLAIQLPNCLEFVLTHLAASRIGLIFNPLSPAYRKKELNYMLSHCNTKAIVTADSFKKFNHEKLAVDLKKELKDLEHVIITGHPEENGSLSFTELLSFDSQQTKDFEDKELLPIQSDPAVIMFTSGTESNPKAVLHSFETFVPAHLKNGKEYDITNRDTILSLTPLCHMFSLPLIIEGMHLGAKQYIQTDYQLDMVMDVLSKEKVTYLTAAPAHLIDMIHYMRNNQERDINLRIIQTGGSKIPAEMVKDLRNLTDASIVSQWGMTEICAGTFTRPNDNESLAWETVGRPTPAGKVAILDENHRPLNNKEVGEIAFKGDCLFKEYYKNPTAMERAFTDDGYFLTGDQGWLDEEGYLHFEGRKKDTINRGGLKFHASEVEEVLQMHPKIYQAAVVSVPDTRLGERACAFISLREKSSIDLQEITSFLLDKGFAKYKLPEFLEVRETLPTTPSGKVMKATLHKDAESVANNR